VQQPIGEWHNTLASQPRFDFARRLYLYRTCMQAMRIAQVAKGHAGQTVLVIVGFFHKDDIERILRDFPHIELVQPSTFGEPDEDSINYCC
jgi:hypothetical protein